MTSVLSPYFIDSQYRVMKRNVVNKNWYFKKKTTLKKELGKKVTDPVNVKVKKKFHPNG